LQNFVWPELIKFGTETVEVQRIISWDVLRAYDSVHSVFS